MTSKELIDTKRPDNLRRIKHDVIDRRAREEHGIYNMLTAEVAALPAIIASGLTYDNQTWLGTAMTAVPFGIYLTKAMVENRRIKSWPEEHLLTNPDLGYSVGQYVYQGDEPIVLGDTQIKKGDNFLDIKLPTVKSETAPPSPKMTTLTRMLYERTFQHIREEVKDRDYTMVTFQFPGSVREEMRSTFSVNDSVLNGRVLSGKDDTAKEPGGLLSVLTRAEFEELTAKPVDLLLETADALRDHLISYHLTLGREATTVEKKRRIEKTIAQQAKRIILKEVRAHLSNPEDAWRRDRETQAIELIKEQPEVTIMQITKTRKQEDKVQIPDTELSSTQESTSDEIQSDADQPEVSTKKTSTMLYYAQFVTRSGNITHIPLSKLLSIGNGRKITDKEKVKQIIEDNVPKPYHRSQLAYIILELLQDHPFDEQFDEKELSTEEKLLETIHDEHLLIVPPSHKQISTTNKRSYLNRRTFKQRAVAAIAPFLIAFTATPMVNTALEQVSGNGSGYSSSTGHTEIQTTIPIGFPDKLPPKHIDWKISGTGYTNGYYTESTSHQPNADGSWQVNTDRIRNITFPRTLQAEQYADAILLQRVIAIEPNGEISFKVPIKTSTRLSALDIVDIDGSPVDYEAFELSDGTIEVHVRNSLMSSTPIVTVEAGLVSDQPLADLPAQVHAAGKLTEHLDDSKLNSEAKAVLMEAGNAKPSDRYTTEISRGVREDHTYSLEPQGKERLKQARTFEERVNVAMELAGINCGVANSTSVLLNSENPDPQQIVNLATGYLVGVANPESGRNTSYLRSDAFHAYGLTGSGSITEATPNTISGGPLTDAYVKQLSQTPEETAELQKEWDDMVGELTEDAIQDANEATATKIALALSLGLLAFGSMAYMVRRSKPYIGRVARSISVKETVHDLRETVNQMVLNKYEPEELVQAYRFFAWLSWTDESTIIPPAPETTDKNELLHLLGTRLDPEVLEHYANLPPRTQQAYENAAGITPRKLRFLARYIMK